MTMNAIREPSTSPAVRFRDTASCGPQQTVDDPRLPPDLRHHPAQLAGEVREDDGDGHDPEEPPVLRKASSASARMSRKEGEQHEEEPDAHHQAEGA